MDNQGRSKMEKSYEHFRNAPIEEFWGDIVGRIFSLTTTST